MKKVISFIKYYSNFIFPTIICISCIAISNHSNVFIIDITKASALVSIVSSFIGILLTILTIYLAVPKNPVKIKQLKESSHQHIYLANILTGIILSLVALLIWIYFGNILWLSALFLASISNIIITIYYTFSLIKIMEG